VLRKSIIACALVLSLAGCTSMISTEHLDVQKTPVLDGAVSYSLPMTMLKLSVIRSVNDKGRITHDIGYFNDQQSCKTDGNKFCSEILTIADPNHNYLVRFRGNALFDDDLTLGVNKQGFLTGATGKSKDRSADIVVGAVRTALGDFPQPKLFSDAAKAEEIDTIIVDPHDRQFMDHANSRLHKYNLQVTCGECGPSVPAVRAAAEEIYYRQRRTVFLRVTDLGGRTKAIHPISTFNGSPLIAQRLERSPFVERETVIAYTDGVATSIQHKKPSEGLGLVTAVGNIAGAIAFSPFNAMTAQTGNLSTEKKYLEAREALLKQQQAMPHVAVPTAGNAAPQTYSAAPQYPQTGTVNIPPKAEVKTAVQQFQDQQQQQQQQQQIQQFQEFQQFQQQQRQLQQAPGVQPVPGVQPKAN
jgi:hypothetical protein